MNQATLFSPYAHSRRTEAIDALHAATAIYTAEPVVDDLLGHIDWPRASRRLVDPSCGDGVFLGRALERLLEREPDCSAERILAILEGWEIHPHAAYQAHARIAQRLVRQGWTEEDATRTAGTLVRNADFLTECPNTPRYHVIVGNPPYLRAVNVPELLRLEYSTVTPDYARADLLHAFLDRCSQLLAKDGVVAMVTADRWLFNLGAARLREAIGTKLSVHHLERLDPASCFYRPKQRRAGTPPRIHPVAVVLGAAKAGRWPLTRAAIHPDDPDGCTEVLPGRTLEEVAHVRQGPWLGTPGIFVVDEDAARRLPPEFLVPAVSPKDIIDGRLGPIRRWAIRTSADKEPPPEIMAHMDAQLPRMALRGRRTPRWLPPESWGPLPHAEPSLLIPRIAKTLKPVELPPGVLPLNHDVSIVASGTMPLDEIRRWLSSPTVARWMRARAARLEDGYHSITTTLLRQLPI